MFLKVNIFNVCENARNAKTMFHVKKYSAKTISVVPATINCKKKL